MAHAASLTFELIDRLAAWRIAPIVVAHMGRVAIGDTIGERLNAGLVCASALPPAE
ncbi:ethanolamine ammonia-lyase light chain EutC [Novosphingobium sp. AP12]|uniref:ethanolamine ammonia-lyase light chain EutC n=1 Tax=Novosphingobium sp. AP12 TaxID=1144305 RepID=UPI0002720A3F|nr:ethanolamine ammonia-lyase light chain EutC [Novosphingobium sp. AP12]EJL34959.1 ethanolamine ammonia-lyase, small subunit [Novosphingobium sp. AP12]